MLKTKYTYLISLFLVGCSSQGLTAARITSNLQPEESPTTARISTISTAKPADDADATASTKANDDVINGVLAKIKLDTRTTYSQIIETEQVNENTRRMVWTSCPKESRIIGGGCACGVYNSVAMTSYQLHNAQYCMCGEWHVKMLAYATCLTGTGIVPKEFSGDQQDEASRLYIIRQGDSVGTGSKNAGLPGPDAIQSVY